MAGRTRDLLAVLMEAFDAADPHFLQRLRDTSDPQILGPLVDRWKSDDRPWAREQVLAYLAEPLNSRGHELVVKRLFKRAEQAGNDQLMAAFLIAFDRLVRRVRAKEWRWDHQTRESWAEEVLATPRNTLPKPALKRRVRKGSLLFSYRTRYYLRRRAWRYFRTMAFHRPAEYVPAVTAALLQYTDADFAAGENILDNWGLMHACFGRHAAVRFSTSRADLRDGHSLAELSPAPSFPRLWAAADAAEPLLSLVVRASSRLVRVWAIGVLRADHQAAMTSFPATRLFPLLDHSSDEVQQFGAELFEQSAGLATLPVTDWLRLLEIRSPAVLATICRAMLSHVTPDRLTLADCVRIACAAPVPVARAGVQFMEAKPIDTASDRTAVAGLSHARCAAVAADLTSRALAHVGRADAYDADLVCRFFDSALRPMRDSAWDWLTSAAHANQDAELFRRLLESPYDDVRGRLVAELQRRSRLPGLAAESVWPLWCTVLLGIHRGGRNKIKALRQVSDALGSRPDMSDRLLPMLAVAIRSVRPAEARFGLAAVVKAVDANPALADAVRRTLPELSWSSEAPV